MSLKDVMAADINNVFLKTDEFADHHTIDGQDIICVIDEDQSTPTSIDGVFVVRRHVFVSQTALGYRPVPDQKMKLDGQYLYVVDCKGKDLIEIILEARES